MILGFQGFRIPVWFTGGHLLYLRLKGAIGTGKLRNWTRKARGQLKDLWRSTAWMLEHLSWKLGYHLMSLSTSAPRSEALGYRFASYQCSFKQIGTVGCSTAISGSRGRLALGLVFPWMLQCSHFRFFLAYWSNYCKFPDFIITSKYPKNLSSNLLACLQAFDLLTRWKVELSQKSPYCCASTYYLKESAKLDR